MNWKGVEAIFSGKQMKINPNENNAHTLLNGHNFKSAPQFHFDRVSKYERIGSR